MLKGLSLFSGVGGMEIALKDYVKTICYCEQDRHAQSVLFSRMDEGRLEKAPIYVDVKSLNAVSLEDVLEHQNEANSMAGKLKKLTQEQVAESVKLYEGGMSLGDLAHVFHVTRQAMWDLLRRRTELRSQQRVGKDNHFYRGGARADARAHDICEKAVASGKLLNPGKCENCGCGGKFADGRTSIQAHHDDYNEPLSVRWLCQRCHHEWHKHNKPVPAREGGGKGAPAVDIIFGGFP